jgi:heme exporter protein A
MIKVQRLVKTFGLKPVLRGVDFQASPGEFVAIVGPNGAGKTTFLRILATLSRPNMGDVFVAGYSLPAQAAAVRKRLGVVFHQPLIYGDLTAWENLYFYGQLYDVHNLRRRVETVLELVGLLTRRRDLVRQYSRGMQQRLAIGRAILHDPEILLFDEPHTGLDQQAAEMLDGVLGEVMALDRTVVMTSHDLTRSAELATRVDILSNGEIAASIPRGEVEPIELHSLYRSVIYG